MARQRSLPKGLWLSLVGLATFSTPQPTFAFCNPDAGESATCVQNIELNPIRKTEVKISRESMVQIHELLEEHDILSAEHFPRIRISVEQLEKWMNESSPLGFYYNVATDSVGKQQQNCEIYDFSTVPATGVGESLLHGENCTLAAQIILQYTSMVVDLQSEARRRGVPVEEIDEEQLFEVYSSAQFFSSAVAYAFHGLTGPAVGLGVTQRAERWDAWPLGVARSGASFPAGAFVDYTVQPEDTLESISETFGGEGMDVRVFRAYNPKLHLSGRVEAGEQLFVPFEPLDWKEVDTGGKSAEWIALQTYGKERFAEVVERVCALGKGSGEGKCVVPVFRDVEAVYQTFFGM